MIKHAKASKARVSLEIFEHDALMVIEGDRVGFEVPQHLDKLTNEQHFSLAGIEERVKLMKKQLMLRSHLGDGYLDFTDHAFDYTSN